MGKTLPKNRYRVRAATGTIHHCAKNARTKKAPASDDLAPGTLIGMAAGLEWKRDFNFFMREMPSQCLTKSHNVPQGGVSEAVHPPRARRHWFRPPSARRRGQPRPPGSRTPTNGSFVSLTNGVLHIMMGNSTYFCKRWAVKETATKKTQPSAGNAKQAARKIPSCAPEGFMLT